MIDQIKWHEFQWIDRGGRCRKAQTTDPNRFAQELETDGIMVFVAYDMKEVNT